MATTAATKKAIATAFKGLLATLPFEQIRVGDVCERSGRNRKSFYYHFKDKYDLVCWIFDSEFVARLREALLADELTFEEISRRLMLYFYENRSFYRKILQIEGQNSFKEYFGRMVEGYLRELMGVPQGGKAQDFCISFYADAILQSLERWLLQSPTLPPDIYLDFLRTSLRSFPKTAGGEVSWWEDDR